MRMLKAGLTLIVAMFALSWSGQPAAAGATCSDYSNQADAQRAADTIDADGDGIYCEALPCPCLKPGLTPAPPTPPAPPEPAPQEPTPAPREPTPAPTPQRRARVRSARITSVIDGDTVRVKYGNGAFDRVRLIGIDAPETKDPGTPVECGGTEATDNMLRLSFTDPQDTDADGLLDERGGEGRRVTVRTDSTQDTRDRFGRLLAYVTTLAGKNLATQQLSAGWAKVFVFDQPFQQLDRFNAVKGRAKSASRGAWQSCGGNFHRPA